MVQYLHFRILEFPLNKPPIWEWFIPTISGDDWGMVQMALFYPHYQKRMVDNGTLDITII